MIQGSPLGVRSQFIRSAFPPYSTTTLAITPGTIPDGRWTQISPPRLSKESDRTAPCLVTCSTEYTSNSGARSSTICSVGVTIRAVMVRDPRIVLSDGCTSSARS